MISIRTCVDKLDDVKNTHVDYVVGHVRDIIAFYINVFGIYLKRRSRINLKEFSKEIASLNRKDYKTLLKPFLRNGRLKNNGDLVELMNYDKLVFKKSSISSFVNKLNLLNKNLEEIILLDFSVDFISKNEIYYEWVEEFGDIGFLYGNIFDYEGWFSKLDPKDDWGPYQLAIALNLHSCPYCNRHYTYSIADDGQKKGRPDFDHFLPKAKYPLLALSFFNLVPSCKNCNGPSVKGQRTITYETHLNPYEDFGSNIFRFYYRPSTYEAMIGASDELEVHVAYGGDYTDTYLKTKVEGNIELFLLKEQYGFHNDVVAEIIRKRYISDDKYIETLKKSFKQFNFSQDDIYRLAFGGYYHEKDFHRRPLSKMIKDIAIEMEIVNSY